MASSNVSSNEIIKDFFSNGDLSLLQQQVFINSINTTVSSFYQNTSNSNLNIRVFSDTLSSNLLYYINY